MTFHYGANRELVFSFHLRFGSWLAYVGYGLTQGVQPADYVHGLLFLFGTLAATYQAWLWYAFPNDDYAYNVPGWLLHLFHIGAGLFLVWVSRQSEIGPVTGATLLVVGAAAVLYFLHLWILGPC